MSAVPRRVAVDWQTVPTAAGLRPGSSRQALCGERLSFLRATLAPDAVFDGVLHAHEHEQLVVVLEGDLELQVEQARGWLAAGDVAYLQPGVFHAAVGVGHAGACYYEIFAPPRTDQLPGFVGRVPLVFQR